MDTHHVRWPEVSPRRYSVSDCFSLPLDTHALGIAMCGPDVTCGFSIAGALVAITALALIVLVALRAVRLPDRRKALRRRHDRGRLLGAGRREARDGDDGDDDQRVAARRPWLRDERRLRLRVCLGELSR